MAASMRYLFFCTLRQKSLSLTPIRRYTIEPPEWMGGRSILQRTGNYDFPEQNETFEQRLSKIKESSGAVKSMPVNIGVEYKAPAAKRSELLSISLANRRDKALEQAARLHKLNIPLDLVKAECLTESLPQQTRMIADHYGIYQDLFGDAYFVPVVNMRISFDYDEESVTPVCRGNCILPAESKWQPMVEYESQSDTLWTLLLTNLDGHLTDNDSEYVHWLLGNIPASDLSAGDLLVNYLQPLPARGTGFHRHVFVLFEQKQRIDYAKLKRSLPCNDLKQRTFKTAQFFAEYRNALMPKGLAFFQSEWDESVRKVFHHTLAMAEPTFEYEHPVPYHPPPLKYPHRQPFDRYFDRYRDKKDLAEEVLKMRLRSTSPFTGRPPADKYPLVHRPKTYKPSWLKLREELMHRRLEQFKDLN